MSNESLVNSVLRKRAKDSCATQQARRGCAVYAGGFTNDNWLEGDHHEKHLHPTSELSRQGYASSRGCCVDSDACLMRKHLSVLIASGFRELGPAAEIWLDDKSSNP
jgi:hypothetical protein